MTRCTQCLAESHPPLVSGAPLCLPHKLSAARDGRARNGAVMLDMSRWIGTVHGSRTVTEIVIMPSGKHRTQGVRLTCTCGAVADCKIADCKNGIPRCRQCYGTGIANKGWRQRQAAADKAESTRAVKVTDIGPAEICNCAWFGGRQVSVCRVHAEMRAG